MSVTIMPIRGHWEVHINGKFYCSADSYAEAINEYKIYLKERNKNEV